jgi:pimeloyl-ACP methyl ester carboxylesterase
MKRTAFLGVVTGGVAVLALPRLADAAESDITLATPTGSIYGTLTLPASAPPFPVVLIVPGSGAIDRNGDSGPVQANTYKLLAAGLAAKQIASVRYDKRGVGASAAAAKSESDLRFETYIGDVAAWLRMLRANVRFSKLVVAGHSEGSLLGMIAVQNAPADAFVSLEGAGRPAAEILRWQLKPKLPAQLYAQSDAIISALQQGHTVADVPADLLSLFRPSVQPYLISWFKYDPIAEIAKVRTPSTIVQGTADIQVTVALDAEPLHRADPAARFVVVNGMNHMLKYAPDTSSQTAILQGYENPALPIDPQVIEAISAAA